jgi:hypothetical protein
MTHRKVDLSQALIVQYLIKRGASVQSLAAQGKGVPDLLVGWQKRNLLLEVKSPKEKGRAAGKLTDDQIIWQSKWKGEVFIVYNIYEVEDILSGRVKELEPTNKIVKQSALEKQ